MHKVYSRTSPRDLPSATTPACPANKQPVTCETLTSTRPFAFSVMTRGPAKVRPGELLLPPLLIGGVDVDDKIRFLLYGTMSSSLVKSIVWYNSIRVVLARFDRLAERLPDGHAMLVGDRSPAATSRRNGGGGNWPVVKMHRFVAINTPAL